MKKKVVKKTPKKSVKRVRKQEDRGISKVVIIVVAALVLSVGGAFIFLSQKGSLPMGMGGIVKAPLNPNCKYNDPDLCKFVNNWQGMSQYSVSYVSTSPDMGKMEGLYEIDGETKFHMMSSQDGKENYNMISIGDTTYTKDYSDNKWWKQTLQKTEEDSSVESVKEEFDFGDNTEEDTTTYKALGKEPCGNMTCFKYQVVMTDINDTVEYIWFDDKEYLLRKQRSEGPNNTVSESTFSYSGVRISEPSPVKEGTPDAMSMPGMSEEDKKAYEEMKKMYENSSNTQNYEVPTSYDSGTQEEYYPEGE